MDRLINIFCHTMTILLALVAVLWGRLAPAPTSAAREQPDDDYLAKGG